METIKKNIIKPKTILLWLFIGTLAVFTFAGTVNNSSQLKVFFFDLYSNRLVAENYVYQLNSTFNQKKTGLLNYDLHKGTAPIHFQHDSIRNMLAEFSKTKLTKEEEVIFKSLNTNIKYSENLELTLTDKIGSHDALIAAYDFVLLDLNSLSAIQIKEGAILFNEVQKSSSTIAVKSELLWALGLILLLVILSSIKNKNYRLLTTKQPYSLN